MTDDREPEWLDAIRNRVAQTPPPHRDPKLADGLRRAAVLVLLIDSADGPKVLLTQRAGTLTNYPGAFVFPGGTAEPNDTTPIETALREASEEAGLDPTRVRIIGTLPALELPETGFVVTPVIGWSTELDVGHLDPAEVAAVVELPLHDFDHGSVRVQHSPATDTSGSRFIVDGTTVGDMTSLVIDALLNRYSGPPARSDRL